MRTHCTDQADLDGTAPEVVLGVLVGSENAVTAVTREFPPTMDPTTLRPHHAPDRPCSFSAVVFSYLAVRRVLSLVVLLLRRSGSTEIEILVLRHELEILRRRQLLPSLQPADRVWLAMLSRLLARERF